MAESALRRSLPQVVPGWGLQAAYRRSLFCVMACAVLLVRPPDIPALFFFTPLRRVLCGTAIFGTDLACVLFFLSPFASLSDHPTADRPLAHYQLCCTLSPEVCALLLHVVSIGSLGCRRRRLLGACFVSCYLVFMCSASFSLISISGSA